MTISTKFDHLAGRWRGKSRLYLAWNPEESMFESETTASVSLAAKGRFLKIEYDWRHEGQAQEGLILLGRESDSELFKSCWIDSWHMGDKFMISEGRRDASGAVDVKGFYTVPGYPEWGWRTNIAADGDDSFRIVMYNVSPEGEEELAVEAFYKRV